MLHILKRIDPDTIDYLEIRINPFRLHWFHDFDTTFLYVRWKDHWWRLLPLPRLEGDIEENRRNMK